MSKNWLRLVILASNVWSWTWNLYYWCRSHYKVSGLKWFCHRCPSSGPCRSIESQQDEINLSWNNIGAEGAKPDVWHNSLWLQVSENHVMKMESWCTIDVRDLPRISDMGWKQDGSGREGVQSTTCKARQIFIQVLNSIKQYRIFWKILVKLEIFPNSPSTAENQKSLKLLPTFFSAEIHLDISECEATKCKPCSPPSVPMQFHDKSMLFTIVLTFNASARACEKKDVKPCQTMSNPRAYNAICANI